MARGHRLLPSCAQEGPRARASPNGAEHQPHSSTNNNRGAPQTQSPEGFLGRGFVLQPRGHFSPMAAACTWPHSPSSSTRVLPEAFPSTQPPSETKKPLLCCTARPGVCWCACKGQQRSTLPVTAPQVHIPNKLLQVLNETSRSPWLRRAGLPGSVCSISGGNPPGWLLGVGRRGEG